MTIVFVAPPGPSPIQTAAVVLVLALILAYILAPLIKKYIGKKGKL